MLVLVACGSANAQEETTENQTTITNETNQYFSNRDLDPSYDSVKARITLEGASAMIGGEGATLEGTILKISQEGVYELTGISEGIQVLIEVADTEKVQLVFNNVTMTNEEPVVYVNTGDKVFITLKDGTTNQLVDGITRLDESLDAVIFTRSDLIINGTGELIINADFKNDIESKDDLRITGGIITITASNHALNANDAINIQGTVLNLTAGKDGIHAENNDDITLGNVYLNPTSLTISAAEDGVDAFNLLEIAGGDINIIQSDKGMEASVIHQTGGNVSIVSSDDGLNASDGTSNSQVMMSQGNSVLQIVIDNGKLEINVEGDGIDSNGSVTINGGEIYVRGSQVGGNGAFDSDLGVTMNGGTVIAIGTADMAQDMNSGSEQASITVTADGQAGSVITISDQSGNVLATHTATKPFQWINATVPGMVEGESYIISVDNGTVEVTASKSVQSTGMGGPGGGPRNNGW